MWDNIFYRIDEEGFDYCMRHYSDWKEINDKKFHELRLKYIQAQKELDQYIEEKYNDWSQN